MNNLFNENAGVGVFLMVVALTWPYWLTALGLVLLAALGYKMIHRHKAEGRDVAQPESLPMQLWNMVKYPLCQLIVTMFGKWLQSIGYYK